MNTKFPSTEEQEMVRQYVLGRPLYRPPVTYTKVALWILVIVLVSIGFSILLHKVLFVLGFIFPKLLYYLSFFIIELLVLLRPLAITLIISALCTRRSEKTLFAKTDLFGICNSCNKKVWNNYRNYKNMAKTKILLSRRCLLHR